VRTSDQQARVRAWFARRPPGGVTSLIVPVVVRLERAHVEVAQGADHPMLAAVREAPQIGAAR
jgi:hypothetical protein